MDRFAANREAALQRRRNRALVQVSTEVQQLSYLRTNLIRSLYEMYFEGEKPHYPQWVIDLIERPIKSHVDRFNLFRFLILNGVAPPIARAIVLWFFDKHPRWDQTNVHNQRDMAAMQADAQNPGSPEYYRFVKDQHFDINAGNKRNINGVLLPGMERFEYARAYRRY